MHEREMLKKSLAGLAIPWLTDHVLAQTSIPSQIVVSYSGGATQATNRKTFYNDFEKRYGLKIVNTSPVDNGLTRSDYRFKTRKRCRPDALASHEGSWSRYTQST